jgi:hypothetical protein
LFLLLVRFIILVTLFDIVELFLCFLIALLNAFVNQGAQEITNVLGSSNNSLMQNQDQNQTQNQGNDEGWREL